MKGFHYIQYSMEMFVISFILKYTTQQSLIACGAKWWKQQYSSYMIIIHSYHTELHKPKTIDRFNSYICELRMSNAIWIGRCLYVKVRKRTLFNESENNCFKEMENFNGFSFIPLLWFHYLLLCMYVCIFVFYLLRKHSAYFGIYVQSNFHCDAIFMILFISYFKQILLIL